MMQFSSTLSTFKWIGHNVATELLREHATGYMRMAYESFMASPAESVEAVGAFLDEDVTGLSFGRQNTVCLGVNHTVWGNPSRQRGGEVTLKVDDAWRKNLSLRNRITVTALSWPLLLRYGFGLSLGPSSRP